MGKPNPRKLEKKRRKARDEARLRRRQSQSQPQAYHGNKYKTDEYATDTFQVEQAIYTTFVATSRQAVDQDVRRSLESMIGSLRRGGDGMPEDDNLFGELLRQALPRALSRTQDEMIGILRTILGSIEVWGTPSPRSRGYLSFLEGFMHKAGVCCEQVEADDDFAEPAAENDLLSIGRAWCAGEIGAEPVFRALAEQLIADGEPDEVAETCQQLIGEGTSTAIFRELSQLAITAQQHLARPAPAEALRRLLPPALLRAGAKPRDPA